MEGAQYLIDSGFNVVLDGMVAVWVPSAVPIVFEGTGILIRSNGVFFLPMHCDKRGTTKGEVPPSGLFIENLTPSKVDKNVFRTPYTYCDFFITAGNSGEEECLVESDNYDLNNQLTYPFTNPVKVCKGDEVYFEIVQLKIPMPTMRYHKISVMENVQMKRCAMYSHSSQSDIKSNLLTYTTYKIFVLSITHVSKKSSL